MFTYFALIQSSLKIDDLIDPRMSTVSSILKHVHKGTIENAYTVSNGDLGISYAELNNGRLPYYHRLDISVSKRFKLNNRIAINITSSVTNAYNRENIFYFNRVKYERINQLPLMPSFGINCIF